MTEPEQTSPFARRGFIAAALVVGLIVVAVIVIAVSKRRGRPRPGPAGRQVELIGTGTLLGAQLRGVRSTRR
ncbi:hypothetical protein [Modestobacter sp. SYSU DS0511]